MPRNAKSLALIFSLVCTLISVNVSALQADRKQTINVEADKASINKKTGTSNYSGNVVVQQGSMRITAEELAVYTRDGKLVEMIAQGKPVKFQQRVEKGDKDISAIAEKMTFQSGSNIVIFEQGAELRQGANAFASNRIIYNISKDTVDAGKSSGGDRVTITIQPAADPATPETGTTPK